MPEATVHKNDFLELREDNIGLSGKVGSVQTKSEAHSMKH